MFDCICLQGKSKLARMAWSGSLTLQPHALAPHFANNDYVTALITWSAVHSHHQVLLACGLLCVIQICELHLESSGITAASRLRPLGKPQEERRQRDCCYHCRISQERTQLWPLCQPRERLCCGFLPASPLVPYLPWVQGTENIVWIGITNRMRSNTPPCFSLTLDIVHQIFKFILKN